MSSASATVITVSQDAFDDLMKENMELLELSAEEALKETVEQLHAQGADLSLVVQIPFTSDGSTPTEQALYLLASSELDDLRSWCAQSLAHRCLAAKCGAFKLLYDKIKAAISKTDDVTLIELLNVLAGLLEGQPDVVTDDCLTDLVDLLSWSSSHVQLFCCVCRVLRFSCTLHESNRQSVVAAELIPKLVSKMNDLRGEGAAVREACLLMQILTKDDDVRAVFGCGHEHAKKIMLETPALDLLLALCVSYQASSDIPVATAVFGALCRLAVRDEFCQEVLERQGVSFILQALEAHMSDRGFAIAALELLKILAGNDNVKVAAVQAGVFSLIVAVANKHVRRANVAAAACAASAALCLRQPTHAFNFIVTLGGAALLAQLLQIHSFKSAVLVQVCAVVCTAASNQAVSSFAEVRDTLLDADMENLLNAILNRIDPDRQTAEAAKDALRTLGCKVALVELWTGKRGEIPRDD